MNSPRYAQPDFFGYRQVVARWPDEKFRAHLAQIDDRIINLGAPKKLTWQMKAVLRGLRKERDLLCSLRERLQKGEAPLPAPPPVAEDSLFKEDAEGVFD